MDKDSQQEKVSNKLKQPKYLLVALIGLQVILLTTTIFVLKSRAGTGGESNSTSSSFLPIWIAVFIPIIATMRKRQTVVQKSTWLWLLVGLATLVLLGMIVFLLKTLN
jgi:uncharacterized membrane protein YhaH (DUF805 family)